MSRQPTKSYALYLLAFAVLPLLAQADDLLSAGLSPADLLARLDSPPPPLVVDVRKPVEFGIAHIPGAINIPVTRTTLTLSSS